LGVEWGLISPAFSSVNTFIPRNRAIMRSGG
jgi:hypothetical protein